MTNNLSIRAAAQECTGLCSWMFMGSWVFMASWIGDTECLYHTPLLPRDPINTHEPYEPMKYGFLTNSAIQQQKQFYSDKYLNPSEPLYKKQRFLKLIKKRQTMKPTS